MGARRISGLSIFLLALVTGHPTAAALNAPFALVATAVSSSQINLSWRDADPRSLSYSIERSRSQTRRFAATGGTGRQDPGEQATGQANRQAASHRVSPSN